MSKLTMTESELRNKMIEEIMGKKGAAGGGKPAKSSPPEPTEPEVAPIEVDTSNPTLGSLTGITSWGIYVKPPYNPEDWPEEVRGFIPSKNPNFVYTEAYRRFHMAVDVGLKVALVGPPGTGKDETVKQYCALMQIPYRRLTGMRNVTPDMVIGRKTMENGTICWESGEAEIICRHGGVLVLSEPAAFPPDTFFAFQSALETNGYLSIMDHPDPSSRMLPINPKTNIVLTSNVRGYGDDVDKYAATNVMDASTLNRIESMQFVPPMKIDEEVSALLLNVPEIHKDVARKMVQLGNLIRAGWDKGEIEPSWSMRNLVAWGKMSRYVSSISLGFKDTFYDKMSDKEKETVRKLWRDVGFSEGL